MERPATGSPINFSAIPSAASDGERRASLRYVVNWRVSVMSRDRKLPVMHGRAVDISMTGISFVTDSQPPDAMVVIYIVMQTIDLCGVPYMEGKLRWKFLRRSPTRSFRCRWAGFAVGHSSWNSGAVIAGFWKKHSQAA